MEPSGMDCEGMHFPSAVPAKYQGMNTLTLASYHIAFHLLQSLSRMLTDGEYRSLWRPHVYAHFSPHLSASAILRVPLQSLKPQERCVKVQFSEVSNLHGPCNSSFVPMAYNDSTLMTLRCSSEGI